MVSVAMMSLLVVQGLFSVAAWADMIKQGPATMVNDAQGTHRALLVGIDNYAPEYGPSPLPSCVNDAMGVRNTMLLADPGQRWSASSIQVLTNTLATCGAIRTALQSLAAVSQPGDLVLYAHSSHGGQYSGTSVFLCAYDQDYSAVSLGQDLALFNSGVTVIVLVDACYSGGLFKQEDGWPFSEMAMQSYTEAKTKQYQSKGLGVPKDLGNNIAFMTACDYSQTSLAGDPYSLYIGAVITGCLEPALDVNRDGLYQFSELHAYAAQYATQQNPNQTAQQFNGAVLTSMVARSVSTVIGPVIKANGLINDITISHPDNLAITVQLDPGQYMGTPVDWWVVAQAGSSWYYLNSSGEWLPCEGNLSNCHPACEVPIVNLPATQVLDMSLLVGSYTFWFVVTSPPNGILNPEPGKFLSNSINVTVR